MPVITSPTVPSLESCYGCLCQACPERKECVVERCVECKATCVSHLQGCNYREEMFAVAPGVKVTILAPQPMVA